MATINITGILKAPMKGYVLSNSSIKFIAIENYFPVVKGSTSIYRSALDGSYNFDVHYGTYAVYILDGASWDLLGKVNITANLPSILNLANLVNTVEPLVAAEISLVQDILAQIEVLHSEVVADREEVRLDLVSTNQDTIDTAADRVQTGLDRVQTGLDRVATNQDTIDTANDLLGTNADLVQTNQDTIDTAADRVQTGLDRIDTANDLLGTNADLVATNQDTIDTSNDRVQTGLDRVATNQDTIDTAADVVITTAKAAVSVQKALESSNSASSAASSLSATQLVFDNFTDRYLGAKASDPTLDNDGDALTPGAVYFNTDSNTVRFYNGSGWEDPDVSSTNSASAALVSELNAAASESNVVSLAAQVSGNAINTAADLVQTNQDTLDTAVDRVQTGLDRVATNADVTTSTSQADASLVSANNSQVSADDSLSSLNSIIALGVFPSPDVDLPFGNKLVETVSDSFSFSRSSTSSSISKSGTTEELAVDEPAITAKGLSVFEGHTNIALDSENLQASSFWTEGGATVSSQDGTLSSDGTTQMWLLDSPNNDSRFYQQVNNTSADITISYEAKQGTFSKSFARYYTAEDSHSKMEFDFLTETFTTTNLVSDAKIIARLANGGYRLAFTVSGLTVHSSEQIQLNRPPDAAGYASYYSKVQIQSGKIASPYVETATTAVTRATDIATIPTKGNLPATGQSFTIMLDAAVPDDGKRRGLWMVDASATFMARRDSLGAMQFFYDTASGGNRNTQIVGIDDSLHRFAFRLDSSSISIHIDGNLVTSTAMIESDVTTASFSGVIRLGLQVSDYLNSELANFRIYHSALSDSQIAFLGGPD